MRFIRAAGLAGIGAFAIALPAQAATIHVETTKDEFGPGGTKKCALREAVQAANENSKFGGCSKGNGADKIVLGAGVYKLSIEVDDSTEDANEEGDIDVTSKVSIAGKGAKKTVIDGNSRQLDERMLHQTAGDLTVAGVTLRNGQEIDDGARGGAIFNQGAGQLTVRNSRVVHNYTYYSGGGLAATDGGKLTVINSLIAENEADDYGGGITTYDGGGRLVIKNTKVLNNTAEDGAAIIVGEPGKLLMTHSVVAGNTGVDYSGGIDLYGTGATIKDSTIANNRSTGDGGYGGGIYDESNDGPVLIEGTTFSNNFATTGGGGIYAESDSWTIRNSTFSHNEALNQDQTVGEGGAIYNDGAAMSLQNVTITQNNAYDTAGIYSDGGTTTIKNSIVAHNRDFGEDHWVEDCYENSGDIISAGHNVNGDGSCDPVGSDITGDSTNQLFPGLDVLGNYGGPTQTHALLPGSPAINHGKGCPNKDQRGHPRNGKCDIGAFER